MGIDTAAGGVLASMGGGTDSGGVDAQALRNKRKVSPVRRRDCCQEWVVEVNLAIL